MNSGFTWTLNYHYAYIILLSRNNLIWWFTCQLAIQLLSTTNFYYSLISSSFYYYLSLFICTYPHNLSRVAYCKYKSKISEHGAFPLVSVQVWHGEPGNMHSYNFEPISPAKTYFGQIIVKRKPQTAVPKTVQNKYLTFWTILERTRDSTLYQNFWDIRLRMRWG